MAVDIANIIEEFTAKLKPLTPKMVETGVIAEEKPPAPPSPPVAPPPEKEACIKKEFKVYIGALPEQYVGEDGKDIKNLVIAFLDSLPECG